MGWAGQVLKGLDLKTSDWTVPGAPREDMSLANPRLSQCLNVKIIVCFHSDFHLPQWMHWLCAVSLSWILA